MGKVAKQAYEAPSMDVVGTFETITQATGSGEFTDAFFPTNTPKSQLTFS